MPATKDFGEPRRRVGRAKRRVLAAVVGLGFVGAAALIVSNEMYQFREDSQAWPRTGTPCPTVAPAALSQTLAIHGLSVRYRVAVDGAEFGRTFGDGDCGMAPS